MGRHISLMAWLCVSLIALTGRLPAQTVSNPSFEYGTSGWTAYSYVPGAGMYGVEPTVDCVGPGCTFDLLDPGAPPDGGYVCGIESSQTNGNGGVCQTFYWDGGPTFLRVDARNYSETPQGVPQNGGCLVRMGIAADWTTNRQDVTGWVSFPWSSSWGTQQVAIPGAGMYTLFIEAYQPNSNYIYSTLWDNVRLGEQVTITNGPTTTPNPAAPETSMIVTWTTDVPSTSRVDFGPNSNYGRTVSSSTMTTFHTLTLSGLTHSSTYHYRVRSASGDFTCESAEDTFNTPIQLIDFNLSLNEDNTVAYISWMTDVPTDAQVEYWDLGAHQTVVEQAPMGYEHQIVLDLEVGKEYRFIATSRGSSPYTSVSTSGKFCTLPAPSVTLMNGGFEDTDELGQHSLYPWVQYTTDVGVPAPHAIDGLIGPYPHDGIDHWNAGIRAYNGAYLLGTQAYWDYKNGGVFQRVSVTPDQYYVLSARFITHRVGGEDGYNTVRIGVDPNGGTDRNSPNVTWWSGFSETNDSQWHNASIAVLAGSSGIATVFVEFSQQYSLEWHVAAADAVSFYPPAPISIGALKSSQWSLGAVLDGKVVTYAHPTGVWCGTTEYMKVYVEEENRSSGVAVMFPAGSADLPSAGDKLTVTGALGEYNKEAGLLAQVWTVDHGPTDPETGLPQGYALPKAFALNQRMIGSRALNQPPFFSNNAHMCTIGLRVRLFGRVRWVSSEGDPGDVVAYIDDGGGILDGSGHAGVRAYLPGKGSGGIYVGDYVAATGVLGTEFVNPDLWPDPTDFYAYSLFINSSADWCVVSGS